MEVTVNINIEKFRYSLVGNGYTLEEVKTFSHERLGAILQARVLGKIYHDYYKGKRIGLYDEGDTKDVLE